MPDIDPSVLPRMSGLTAEFYAWLAQDQLRLQRCSECGTFRHVPRVLCPKCSSDQYTWERSRGDGEVVSWTTTARPLHPAFTAVPFTLAMVAVPEGPRLLAQLVDVDPSEVRISLPVRARFTPVSDTVTVLSFGPEEGGDE